MNQCQMLSSSSCVDENLPHLVLEEQRFPLFPCGLGLTQESFFIVSLPVHGIQTALGLFTSLYSVPELDISPIRDLSV